MWFLIFMAGDILAIASLIYFIPWPGLGRAAGVIAAISVGMALAFTAGKMA